MNAFILAPLGFGHRIPIVLLLFSTFVKRLVIRAQIVNIEFRIAIWAFKLLRLAVKAYGAAATLTFIFYNIIHRSCPLLIISNERRI